MLIVWNHWSIICIQESAQVTLSTSISLAINHLRSCYVFLLLVLVSAYIPCDSYDFSSHFSAALHADALTFDAKTGSPAARIRLEARAFYLDRAARLDFCFLCVGSPGALSRFSITIREFIGSADRHGIGDKWKWSWKNARDFNVHSAYDLFAGDSWELLKYPLPLAAAGRRGTFFSFVKWTSYFVALGIIMILCWCVIGFHFDQWEIIL